MCHAQVQGIYCRAMRKFVDERFDREHIHETAKGAHRRGS
jgi:hypothetical protein